MLGCKCPSFQHVGILLFVFEMLSSWRVRFQMQKRLRHRIGRWQHRAHGWVWQSNGLDLRMSYKCCTLHLKGCRCLDAMIRSVLTPSASLRSGTSAEVASLEIPREPVSNGRESGSPAERKAGLGTWLIPELSVVNGSEFPARGSTVSARATYSRIWLPTLFLFLFAEKTCPRLAISRNKTHPQSCRGALRMCHIIFTQENMNNHPQNRSP